MKPARGRKVTGIRTSRHGRRRRTKPRGIAGNASEPDGVARILVEAGILSAAQAVAVEKDWEVQRDSFCAALVRAGVLEGEDLLRALTRCDGGPALDVDGVRVRPDLLRLVPESPARPSSVLPCVQADQRGCTEGGPEGDEGLEGGVGWILRGAPFEAGRTVMRRSEASGGGSPVHAQTAIQTNPTAPR